MNIINGVLGEEDNRQCGPLLDKTDWSDCLTKAGFSGIDFSLDNHLDAPQRGGSALVSTAVGLTEATILSPDIAIITSGNPTLEVELASKLKANLDDTLLVRSRLHDILDCRSLDLNQSICIFLAEIEHPFLQGICEAAYHGLQKMISACQTLLWVTSHDTQDPSYQLVQGFARCIRQENKALRFITASLDTSRGPAAIADRIALILQKVVLDPAEYFERELIERNGILLINRVIEADAINQQVQFKTTTQPPKPEPFSRGRKHLLKLSIASPGMLDTLQFVDDLRNKASLSDDELEIEIKAAGLNFRDVLIAMGQVTGTNLGGECAGVVTRAGSNTRVRPGDRVVGFVEGSFAAIGRCKDSHLCTIPENLSFSAAAAMPTIFCTAQHALSHVARIKPGETILIHSAAGGFGQAVIQLAKLYGAEIYATVGGDEKRQFLINNYDIQNDHIFSSRSDTFARGIKRMTKSRGVDVVINSLTGEALRSSWECIAPFGRFIEVGKKDIYNYGTLPMYPFAKNVTFACVDLVHLLEEEAELAGTLLGEVMEMLRCGKIKIPQPLHIYEASQVEEAFRYMQSGKNMGKIVLEFNPDNIVPVSPLSITNF